VAFLRLLLGGRSGTVTDRPPTTTVVVMGFPMVRSIVWTAALVLGDLSHVGSCFRLLGMFAFRERRSPGESATVIADDASATRPVHGRGILRDHRSAGTTNMVGTMAGSI